MIFLCSLLSFFDGLFYLFTSIFLLVSCGLMGNFSFLLFILVTAHAWGQGRLARDFTAARQLENRLANILRPSHLFIPTGALNFPLSLPISHFPPPRPAAPPSPPRTTTDPLTFSFAFYQLSQFRVLVAFFCVSYS